MERSTSLLAAMTAGAGLSYLFDPARGARRRARVRDSLAHASTVTRRATGTMMRDAAHRTYGTAATLGGLLRRGGPDDTVLVERVRSKLGRHVSHPHAIDVSASDGAVTLAGPILTAEADGLLRAVHRVSGVHEVVDRLERHDAPGNVPALQGGHAPAGERIDLLQRHWAPTTRCMACTGGSALLALGLWRRDLPGAMFAAAGAALIARAGANVPLAEVAGLDGRRRAVTIQKTITIQAPVADVYAFWSWYENFPRFMSRVLEVTPSDQGMRSHWRVAGPGGVPVGFDAELARVIPNHLLEWRTLPGAAVAHRGVVRFDPVGNGRTRVHIRMSYQPPAGWLGHGLAAAFGVDPKHSMDEDLARMKTLIETGRTPHDAAQRGSVS